MLKRIVASLGYLILAFLLPWWLVLILGIALTFYFPFFIELILAAVIIDSLYGSSVIFADFPFIVTIIILIIFIFINKFKKGIFI